MPHYHIQQIYIHIKISQITTEEIIKRKRQMTSKSNKYTLLNKNQGQQQQYDMIEMVDMDPNKKTSYEIQSQKTEKLDYVQLDDQDTKNKKKNAVYSQGNSQPTSSKQTQPKKPQPPAQQSKPPQQQFINPTSYSVNPNPSRIQMNGTNFQKQNAPQPRKSKIPEMKVACEHCTYEQQVPGNTQVYVCCCCNNMNECFPLYGLFICGYCQCKVCYPYGTSNMIRCTRCGTVNNVPTQPQKKYMTQIPKKSQPKVQAPVVQKSQNKILKDQRLQKQTDFFPDEQLIEQENEPPRKVIRQEEISFDDIPSLNQMQDKELNYPNFNEKL